ncbi:MAG: secondary thiamine-phosphate synthase enzyme YjbQ [Thermoplasmatota archaeon]
MWEITVSSKKRNEMIDITSEIQSLLDDHAITNAQLCIYVPHTTAAITINEGADPSVQYDIINTLEKLIPYHSNYRHGEGNSDAHIKASLLGPSVSVIVKNGRIILGTWQHIFFYEGDGPRTRKVYVDAQISQTK